MTLSNHHPAEQDFRNMLDEVWKLIEKYDRKYFDGEDKEHLVKSLTEIRHKLFELQMQRFSAYINDRGKVENLPEHEIKIMKEMNQLQERINQIIEFKRSE